MMDDYEYYRCLLKKPAHCPQPPRKKKTVDERADELVELFKKNPGAMAGALMVAAFIKASQTKDKKMLGMAKKAEDLFGSLFGDQRVNLAFYKKMKELGYG